MNSTTVVDSVQNEIIWPLANENSHAYIQRILATRGREKDIKHYQEQHHIIPKSCNGTDDTENLIFLYPQEHYEVHRLLALENPNEQCLQSAWWLLCHVVGDNDVIYVSADDYAEAKLRFSQIQKQRMMGENNPIYGKHHSEETKKKISAANSGKNSGNYGRIRTDEEKQKQSKTFKSHYSKEKHPAYGTTASEDTKAKMSASRKGKKKSEEHKQKIGLAHLGKNNGNVGGAHGRAKKVKCLETGQIFDYMEEAGLWAGLSKSSASSCIGECAKGKRKTGGKHPETGEPLHWEFV